MSDFVKEHGTPVVFEHHRQRFVKLLCCVHECGTCGGNMLAYKPGYSCVDQGRNLFANSLDEDVNLKGQMKRAGIRLQSDQKSKDDRYICDECAANGKSTFICALCGLERTSNQKQEAYGDPPDFLCTVCFETVPAKVWEEKSEALREAHRYDYD